MTINQSAEEMDKVQAQLGAHLECELVDEFNFQMQTAVLSEKVLKLLENEDEYVHTNSTKLRHYSKSALNSASNSIVFNSAGGPLFPTVARTRSSSWISAQSLKTSVYSRSPVASYMDAPLLDKILESKVPSTSEIISMMNLLTSSHSYCPNQSSMGGPMGATCTLADYTQIVSSSEAMTSLVISIRTLLEERAPTCLISATVPINGRLIVCGDTHGQLEDLIWIFFKNGLPSASNVYIFNGDIADRGGHALEIFLLLFLFKLNCYESVHIMRGNHEDDYCNIYYGFLAELKHKFGPIAGGALHYEFLQLFYALPLACVIDSWVGSYRCSVTGALIDLSLAAGGEGSPLSPSSPSGGRTEILLRRKDAHSGHRAFVKSNELSFEKRIATREMNHDGVNVLSWGNNGGDTWEYMSPRLLVLHGGIPVPPNLGTTTAVLLRNLQDLPHRMKIPPAPKTVLEQWMYQMLWSDPQEVDGPKGRGTAFFHSHTKAFAEANNLAAILRAHQVPNNQRGVSFHHKQRMVTIFSASNYCGSSQNYGGVAIFTPQWFPSLALNRTLFEHWAPPLSVSKDVLSKHQNATQDVRLFIAHEIESERAPYDRGNVSTLHHLEEKVAEYVSSLIVEHKESLWGYFYEKKVDFVSVDVWEQVCGAVIGRHFPWRSLLEQLEVEVIDNEWIAWPKFLGRFKAGCKFGEPLVDTWDNSVVRGFFHELLSSDLRCLEEKKSFTLNEIVNLISTVCPQLGRVQVSTFCQALMEGETRVASETVLAATGEYIRALFGLLDSAGEETDSVTVQLGRDALDLFPALRIALEKVGTNVFDFYKQVLCLGKSGPANVDMAAKRLEDALEALGLGDKKHICKASLAFLAAEDNETKQDEISLAKFVGGCFLDGTGPGEKARQRIAEHATASLYFHRNALRCACVHLDKSRGGQIDRHSFRRAVHALNASLGPEWRLSKHQQRCVIEYMPWQDESTMDDGAVDDRLLAIEYDLFLDSFEISDCQRMSRACSFGWHLVKDSFGNDASMLIG